MDREAFSAAVVLLPWPYAARKRHFSSQCFFRIGGRSTGTDIKESPEMAGGRENVTLEGSWETLELEVTILDWRKRCRPSKVVGGTSYSQLG